MQSILVVTMEIATKCVPLQLLGNEVAIPLHYQVCSILT